MADKQHPSGKFADYPKNGRGAKRPCREDRAGDGQPAEDKKPRGATAALIELDRDLMKLLVRRATLVSRMRGGKESASTPAAIQAEKAVRVAWESGALAFSKDPRFVRQLFSLLQDIKVLTKEQAEGSGSFNLSPAKRPVSGVMTGPVSARAAQMDIALAACLGAPLLLDPVPLSAPIMDCVKAFSQTGVSITHSFNGNGRLSLAGGNAAVFADASIFAGEDLFTLHLAALLAAGKPGVCRLNGGGRLKEADLSALRNMLPLFGARMAHIVPRSRGLPANIEYSGEIPPLVVVPTETGFEALCALLLAPLVWKVPITLNLAAVAANVATAALAEVRPLHRGAGAEIETHGPNIAYSPGPLNMPESPPLPLDEALSAYLLALPAFAGGSITLEGSWPDRTPDAAQAEQLLAWAGLDIKRSKNAITAMVGNHEHTPPLHFDNLAPKLAPLYLALCAKAAKHGKEAGQQPAFGLLPMDEDDMGLALGFIARLGLCRHNDALAPDPDNSESSLPWTGPSAHWGMAYALCSFLQPGLKLSNPGIVSELMPSFWRTFNSLPLIADPAPEQAEKTKEAKSDKPVRRRIIAD